MSASLLEQFLSAIDEGELEEAMALMDPDVRVLVVDGRRAEGAAGLRALLSEFLGTLRSSTHRITAQWHQDDVWIAEVEATCELRDRTLLGELPRAFVLREGPGGITELRVYGAHERPLGERPSDERGLRLGGRWIPPL